MAGRAMMIHVDETVKSKLEREVRRVNRFIETLRRDGHSEELESGGDNTPLSDVADATQIVEEREIATQLLTWLTDRSVELDRALCRIEEGTYGICARCELPVHPERLQALPEAALCLECQKAAETKPQAAPPNVMAWIETASRYRTDGEMD
jgi:DnaK suppressor protein